MRITLHPCGFFGEASPYSLQNSGIVVGYSCVFRSTDSDESPSGISFDPARLPEKQFNMLGVSAEFLDHPEHDGPNVECALSFLWLDASGAVSRINSGPLVVSKSSEWKIVIPAVVGSEGARGKVDLSTTLSCVLYATLMSPGQVLIRSVSIETF